MSNQVIESTDNFSLTTDGKWSVYKSYIYRVNAPEGEMEIAVLESNGKPVGIIGHCGRSGTIVMSWMDAFCRVASMQMERGLLSIQDLMNELSSTTSNELKMDRITNVPVRSGPEAIFIALSKYQTDKYIELRDLLDHQRDKNGNGRSRYASINRGD